MENLSLDARVATQSQARIIEDPPLHDTVLSVRAGPGSGKTFTLTKRVEFMISNHAIKPSEILILSMANRSVNTLKDSLIKGLGEDTANEVTISTFHLFCSLIIDNYAAKYTPELTNRRIVDDLSWRYFASIFLGKFLNLNGTSIQGTFSPSKLEDLVFKVRSGKLTTAEAANEFNINQNYVDALIEYLDTNGMIRYNDLISSACKIIQKSVDDNIELIDQLLKYKVVVVDEFQDMFEDLIAVILKVVKYPTLGEEMGSNKHLTIAGDPYQSIYDFLGSKPELMDTVDSIFPHEKTIHKIIEESFRCTPEVLQCAVDTCLDNNSELAQKMYSVKDSSHQPVIKRFSNPTEEYDFIASEIMRLCLELGGLLKLSDFAILSRSNKEVEEMNSVLSENYGLKYNKLSSSLSWTRSKVQLLLSILRVLERSQGSELALLCLLLFIDSDIGGKTRVSKVFSLSRVWGNKEGMKFDPLEDYLVANFHPSESTNIDKSFLITNIYKTLSQKKVLKRFQQLIKVVINERTKLNQNYPNQTPELLLKSLLAIIDGLGLDNYLNEAPNIKRSMTTEERESLNFEYQKFLTREIYAFNNSLWACYENYNKNEVLNTTGDSFLIYFLKTYNEDFQVVESDRVNTSTIHTAKGLEFPVVFITGISNYFNGPWSSILTAKEEKASSKSRLLYVAMTRSKHLLYLCSDTHIGDVSSPILEHFTTRAPEMNASILSRMSQEVCKPIPTEGKLQEGRKLYTEFNAFRQKRLFSTMANRWSTRLIPYIKLAKIR